MDVFLARQPIFDSEQRVSAYEILYRSGLVNNFDGIDGDEASREVIFNTFQTFGIENLTNAKPVFINFTESLINDETATLFSKDLLVVEILEDVLPSEQVIENSRSLKEMGYKIALDDFIYKPEYEELIELADIVKIDFLLSDKEEIKRLSRDLKNRNIELLAEKVETREDFEYAKKLGFSLFQGFFFSKPEIVISKKIQPIKTTCLQLVSKVNEKEIDFGKIANIVSMDLSLTYNLLKLVNSAAFGFRYRIKSVKHAVVALGEREIKKWIYLVVVNTIGEDEPDELTRLSLIRARFAELIAINTRYKKQSEEMFLLGLFSLLDVILRRPIREVLDEVKASNVIKDALIDGNGEIGIIYKMIIAYEKAEWDEVLLYAESLDIDCYLIVKAYMDALLWYNKLVG
ncbi:HDOD domain-containing protein [Tissierella carlieri]|uniref:HDOD domain-containing protein n=1 Tax=Tissierella carlieri TaxID=689904 RepID=A0ABT1S7B1_9FIRM|nr:HDOD domain-containing protein [Tissierella carlieri]MCQ4922358.1 HDOD domain-containing protein [Tissierella carlieri]